MKCLRPRLERCEMNKIQGINGAEPYSKDDIINITQHFCKELYGTTERNYVPT